MQLDIDGAGSMSNSFASLEIWEVGQFFCFAKEQRRASVRKKKTRGRSDGFALQNHHLSASLEISRINSRYLLVSLTGRTYGSRPTPRHYEIK